MSAVDFLKRVLPWPQGGAPGFINVHWTSPQGQGMPGKPFTRLDDFISFVDWAKINPGFKDIYFCLSLQSETVPSKNNGALSAKRSKLNALAVKAIWFDIDCNKEPPKGYRRKEDAAAAIKTFCDVTHTPYPTAIVDSGNGLHVYWISDTPLSPNEWRAYANGLHALAEEHGLLHDPITTDVARVLRVPGTSNNKQVPPKPVKILLLAPADLSFSSALSHLLTKNAKKHTPTSVQRRLPAEDFVVDPAMLAGQKPSVVFAHLPLNEFTRNEYDLPPLPWNPIKEDCPFFADAWKTQGKDHTQPLWNLTILATTFLEDGEQLAHALGKEHPGYTPDGTRAMWDRKLKEREERRLGWPGCQAFEDAGCKLCKTCPHYQKIKSPLHLALGRPAPPAEPSFVDPYSEFAGPKFPLDVLPPTLAKFGDAEHRALGADPSAITMAALTAVAGAMHAETFIRVADGWCERPILWTALVGPPSTLKTPIIEKVTKPLLRIDHERDNQWRQEHAKWKKNQTAATAQPGSPPPVKPPRCVINDATPEKVAEILSRDPSGSLMVHDELASLLGSFERYNSGQSSRAFFLQCWNGGTFLKDRVGKGKNDPDAEIRVDNLALSVLGGIQPDRLAKLGDLTSDGMLQRFASPVLMQCAERGNEYHPVASAESDFENLIKSINHAPPQNYHFADDALEVRDRVNDYLHRLENLDGFPTALIGAIGKLKGYFARFCLVLHVARQHDPISSNDLGVDGFSTNDLFLGGIIPDYFTPERGRELCKLFRADLDDPNESLSAGLNTSTTISRRTAEAAEKLLRKFLLPHIFGLYDVLANGGQDRDMVRSIGDFILASSKDRLRPSDVTAGVRALRGQPEQKIREWMGRFCAMDWLEPEDGKPGVPPRAWLVLPGLREHFAERRKQAEAARAEAHAILKAGGSRKAGSNVTAHV